MPFKKFLTQKDLEEAILEVADELEEYRQGRKGINFTTRVLLCNVKSILGEIDAVYIPPDVDILTDEEELDDDQSPDNIEQPTDIAGTFELHVPGSPHFDDIICPPTTTDSDYNSSD